MNHKDLLKKTLVIAIIIFFIGAVFLPIVNSKNIVLKNNLMKQNFSSFDPFDQGWRHRMKITINHSKVAGNLVEFPILISFVSSHLGKKAQVDGDDILFTNRLGVANKIYHEIELYDSSSGRLDAWVNIPILSSSKDTVIYLYYGNPTCINQEYPEKVWDSDYRAVYHMNDEGSIIKDSTFDKNDGIENGIIDFKVLGKIWTCIKTDAKGDYFDLGSELGDITSDVTCEAWVKIQDKLGAFKPDTGVIGNWKDKRGYMLHIGAGAGEHKYIHGYINDKTTIINDYQFDTWYYIVFSWKSSSGVIRLYLDGELKDTQNQNTLSDPSNNAYISIYGSDQNRWFNGHIDEIRVSTTARSSDWILTSYNNQNNPSSFIKCAKPKSKTNIVYSSYLNILQDYQYLIPMLKIILQLL